MKKRQTNNELKKILESFMNIERTLAAAIVNNAGLLLESKVSKGINTKEFLSHYDLLDIAEKKGKLKKGNLDGITIKFEQAALIIKKANADVMLLAMIDGDANLGLIELEVERAVRKINEAI